METVNWKFFLHGQVFLNKKADLTYWRKNGRQLFLFEEHLDFIMMFDFSVYITSWSYVMGLLQFCPFSQTYSPYSEFVL